MRRALVAAGLADHLQTKAGVVQVALQSTARNPCHVHKLQDQMQGCGCLLRPSSSRARLIFRLPAGKLTALHFKQSDYTLGPVERVTSVSPHFMSPCGFVHNH